MGKTYISVTNGKCEELFGLLKVPDSVLLKEAQLEIGGLKSYIEELEYKLNEAEEEIKIYKTNLEELVIKSEKIIRAQYKTILADCSRRISELESENLRWAKGIIGPDLRRHAEAVKREKLYKEMKAMVVSITEKNTKLNDRINRIYCLMRECNKCRIIVVNESFDIIEEYGNSDITL